MIQQSLLYMASVYSYKGELWHPSDSYLAAALSTKYLPADLKLVNSRVFVLRDARWSLHRDGKRHRLALVVNGDVLTLLEAIARARAVVLPVTSNAWKPRRSAPISPYSNQLSTDLQGCLRSSTTSQSKGDHRKLLRRLHCTGKPLAWCQVCY